MALFDIFQGFFMPQFKGSWKRLYMEKFLQSYIENTFPSNIHMIEFKELLEMLKPYILSLTIEQLLISDVEECRDEDVIHIDMKFILSSLSNLRDFSIACGVKNCDIEFSKNLYELTENDCTSIGIGLQWTIRLQNYKMHRCYLNPIKLHSLLTNWELLSCLQVVDFMSCGLDDECISILSEFLIKLPSLEQLSLVNNKIGPNGAVSLASSLGYYRSLKVLNLRLNFILDDGGIAIFKAISKHSCVEKLILEGCELGIRTIDSLCDLIVVNSHILEIDLSVNHLHDKKTDRIAQAVCKNDTLQRLDLRMNDISPTQMKSISEKLTENRRSKNKFYFEF
ncbi:dynein regulatory complex subunit 5 [Planococcus citri]|uniref:dynein regulatory complex subunit 5 n=1 Tax=Planococcus citri TaxID=170843 RepID=UPI0031F9774C